MLCDLHDPNLQGQVKQAASYLRNIVWLLAVVLLLRAHDHFYVQHHFRVPEGRNDVYFLEYEICWMGRW